MHPITLVNKIVGAAVLAIAMCLGLIGGAFAHVNRCPECGKRHW